MICTSCGHQARVISQFTYPGFTQRYYLCGECQMRFRSSEQMDSKPARPRVVPLKSRDKQ